MRDLDNTAKVFSLEDKRKNNTFRFTITLKENVNSLVLEKAIIRSLNTYPSYKVKIRRGFFWDKLEKNENKFIIKEKRTNSVKSINLSKNNNYLFKVSFLNNKINLDVCHILTDGMGSIVLLKEIIYNYLNIKYKLEVNNKDKIEKLVPNEKILKYKNRKIIKRKNTKKSFLINKKSNLLLNKTNHYVLDLKSVKSISKRYNVSITQYLTSIYIYAIYKSLYNKKYKKDIIVTIPVDLRKIYNIKTLSNFFTCVSIEGDVLGNKNVTFKEIVKQVHNEFINKMDVDNLKDNLAKDIKLGTNKFIEFIPLFIKKPFMRNLDKFVNNSTTSTLSNLGIITIDDKYKEYVDNIQVSVKPGKFQKIKCTMCSYENKLNVTINSNLIDDDFEKVFNRLLIKYIGSKNNLKER